MNWRSVLAVFLFEWKRSLTFARMLWWLLLTLFPVFIVLLIRWNPPPQELPREPWTAFMFALVPMLTTMLGTFLWSTPAISAELEGKSWVYLAVRPYGTTNLLLGKYLATVTWVFSSTLVGLVVAAIFIPHPEAGTICATMARIVVFSCPAYAALYLLIGALFPKRSMVVAVGYTLVFELVISFVPALINTLTIQFRLRTLLVEWAKLDIGGGRSGPMAFIGDPPAWEHAVILTAYTLVLLVGAIGVVKISEFSTVDEADA